MTELPSRARPLNDHEMIEAMYTKESFREGAGSTDIYKINSRQKEFYFDLDTVFDRDPNRPTVFISEFGKKDRYGIEGHFAFSRDEIDQYKKDITEFFMYAPDIPFSTFWRGTRALDVKFEIS